MNVFDHFLAGAGVFGGGIVSGCSPMTLAPLDILLFLTTNVTDFVGFLGFFFLASALHLYEEHHALSKPGPNAQFVTVIVPATVSPGLEERQSEISQKITPDFAAVVALQESNSI